VVAEHVVVKCPYVPNKIREKIAFLKDQMTELLESTELYGGEDDENLESRAIAQATGTEEGAELPTQDLEKGYDPGEGPSTLNTERMVCLFVFTRPAGPAWLTLSFSQPHISRRFQNRKALMGFYWLPRHAECVFLPYTCQTILFQIPVSLRKSSIWLAVQSKFTHKVS
jgi:hypothetical protein